MRTLAIKQPHHDSAKEKNRDKVRSHSISPLSTGMQLLQRQCSCGGGCPRCQEQQGIQTKLKISKPGDKYEQEADLLIAHEHTHVIQQSKSSLQNTQILQRQTSQGSRTRRSITAATVLQFLTSQADPNARYISSRPHTFSEGEPSLQLHKYVRDSLHGIPAIIDMVHFVSIGPLGEAVGTILEYVQIFENPSSAMDPQDFFSNYLGSYFFHRSYYQASAPNLSAQLERFFQDRRDGRISFPMPEGGLPHIPDETRRRLASHSSEAISHHQFVRFVQNLEDWLIGR